MGESNTQISSPLPFGNHHPTTGEPELSFGLSREENRNRVLLSAARSWLVYVKQGPGGFILFCEFQPWEILTRPEPEA